MLGRFVASSSTVRIGKCIFCRHILMKLKMKNWNLTFSLFLKTSEVNRFGRSEEAMMIRFSDMLVHHRVAARVLVLTGPLVSIGHLSQSTNPPNIPFRNKWGVTFQEGLIFWFPGKVWYLTAPWAPKWSEPEVPTKILNLKPPSQKFKGIFHQQKFKKTLLSCDWKTFWWLHWSSWWIHHSLPINS